MKMIAFALVMTTTGAQAADCLHESAKPEPYYKAGVLITPQSDIIIVGDCEMTYEELLQAYIAAPKHAGPIRQFSSGPAVSTPPAAAVPAEPVEPVEP